MRYNKCAESEREPGGIATLSSRLSWQHTFLNSPYITAIGRLCSPFCCKPRKLRTRRKRNARSQRCPPNFSSKTCSPMQNATSSSPKRMKFTCGTCFYRTSAFLRPIKGKRIRPKRKTPTCPTRSWARSRPSQRALILRKMAKRNALPRMFSGSSCPALPKSTKFFLAFAKKRALRKLPNIYTLSPSRAAMCKKPPSRATSNGITTTARAGSRSPSTSPNPKRTTRTLQSSSPRPRATSTLPARSARKTRASKVLRRTRPAGIYAPSN